MHILLVDDSPTTRYVLKAALQQNGIEVSQATDGEEALELVRNAAPDVVVLDVILPKTNGFQVCREIKSTPETAHIPVILLTSKTRERDRNWGLEQGADAYITKPVEPDTLLATVRKLLNREETP